MDSVTTAFELMRLELETEVESLNSDGAKLFHQSEYEEARELVERGKRLQKFCEKVEELAIEWGENFADSRTSEPAIEQREAVRTILSASKAPKSGLLVRFGDGTVISEKTAARTLVKTLQNLGFDRVSKLNVLVNGENIVSKDQSKKYNDAFPDPYYIKTHSSTAQKKRHLEQIASELLVDVEVIVV